MRHLFGKNLGRLSSAHWFAVGVLLVAVLPLFAYVIGWALYGAMLSLRWLP